MGGTIARYLKTHKEFIKKLLETNKIYESIPKKLFIRAL